MKDTRASRRSVRTILIEWPATGGSSAADLIELAPGRGVVFGREPPAPPRGLTLADPGVSRLAGEIRAAEDYWLLSNFSSHATYVVENPAGSGEHVKVPQRRLGAPIPFEFGRLLLPSSQGFAAIMVYASQHEYLEGLPPLDGEPTRSLFTLDETAKYFLVLVALCEPRLRDQPNHDVPTASQVAERLRPLPGCADLTRSAVNFHIDYLARTKLRFRPDAEEPGGRMEGKRAALATLALRLDLVREEHLALLPSRWKQRSL